MENDGPCLSLPDFLYGFVWSCLFSTDASLLFRTNAQYSIFSDDLYNTNSSSVLSVAIEGSSGRILAIVGLVAQKCPLFPLLFCPNYTVQLFFSAFLSHAAV